MEVSPLPRARSKDPATPFAAFPVITVIFPEFPRDVVPVNNAIGPLSPALAALAVVKDSGRELPDE